MGKRKFFLRDYRRRRKRLKTSVSQYSSTSIPSSINTIHDLLVFAHTYTGPNVNVDKLKAITGPLAELNEMVGLAGAKKTILDLIMHFAQNRHAKNTDYLHMVVCGPPGSGKTSFCRIVGKILAKMGILPSDKFTIVKRTDLVAKYLGQTAHRTERLLNSCQGGVMFIDEAYSLAPRDTDRDSFAKEAIDFLNQFLSEHKDDLVCIIAGYEDELDKTIFAMNAGMRRRFPWKFVIEPYTNKELLEIFKRMIKKIGYEVEQGAIDEVFFSTNKELFKFTGGDIETFITKCKFMHTRNTFGKATNNTLTKADILDALQEHISHKKGTVSEPPLLMYL